MILSHKMVEKSAIELIGTPITLPCGLTLPNRLVKCPMQETCAKAPNYDPPLDEWRNIYSEWAGAKYGLIITGQVQVDIRFLSIAGDVVCHDKALTEPVLSKWKEWATIAQSAGTPCIVQLAHPGRMSPLGAGNRPADMAPLCPSSVPVALPGADSWLDKLALNKILGIPKAMSIAEIDEAVANFVRGAKVSREAGFAGCQIHGAHGFLVSQFLSPRTNQRTDDYGGTPEKRMAFLQRLVKEMRAELPAPLCLSVKLNSADYMAEGGLTQDEGLEQVRWLITCGMVDMVEISGGNAETTGSKLHKSFDKKIVSVVPKRESTRIREGFFTDFAERVQQLDSKVPIQLSGGFRSRNGMADAIDSGVCDLLGLGRAAVLEPSLPKDVLLNPDVPDDTALALPHMVRGQWLARWVPVKVVGAGLPIEFFYWNMRRLGAGLKSDPYASIPFVVFENIVGALSSATLSLGAKLRTYLPGFKQSVKIE